MRLQHDAAAWEMSTVPAFWARNLDDFDTARERFERILRAYREHGDEATTSGVLTHLARVEAMTGRMARARELVRQGVPADQLLAQIKTDDIGWAPRIPKVDAFYAELAESK